MSVMETLGKHRSIRKYLDKDIPKELLTEILQNAIDGSSSSGNLNSYSIVMTRDRERKAQLCKFHSNQAFINEAPVLLTFCADQHRTRRWLADRGADDSFNGLLGFLVGAFDAMIVSQSVCVAAESVGLGICYLGTTLSATEQICSFLKLPTGVFPVTSVAIGYPAEQANKVSRLPIDSLVHDEIYQDFSQDRIDEVYKNKEVSGWQRYLSMPGSAELFKEHNIKNLAQFYTSAIKYPRKFHDQTSENLLKALEDQDFLQR